MWRSGLCALLLGVATHVAAFAIPPGQADGVYSVWTRPDGTEEHTMIMNATEALLIRSEPHGLGRSLARRDRLASRWAINEGVSCASGQERLDPGDCDAANSMLDNQCGNGATVRMGMDFYSIRNCAVAYFCNFSGYYDANCDAQTRRDWSAAITQKCGLYMPGWGRHISNDDGPFSKENNFSYGYENYCHGGNNFCSRGIKG
ncbi:hypothetical protein SPBR_09094 [Sporothrix brasiliensis 5110]|uniref:Secreted protein n=1 Tax=Sporothrix brasiliensis 5110 TaxID=1398154 RepID=A0A0C2J292_9PEZI|nr:uncharacterized protein SPBR_09094 [Sporothrix brasiliensis 5110]KIH91192.1 hypothetical protein SPBR_09094 [Sporothrix brasiliensis 5110]